MDAAVGSLDPYTETDAKTQKDVYILKPRIPDALFYDLTHDNESYFKRRTFMDSLSTAALVRLYSDFTNNLLTKVINVQLFRCNN